MFDECVGSQDLWDRYQRIKWEGTDKISHGTIYPIF